MIELKSITAREDFRNLCDRIDYLNRHPDLPYSNEISKELNRLYRIYDSCRDKIIGWQFVPDLSNLEIDENILELAYCVFSKKADVNKFVKKYPEYENDIKELTFEEKQEEIPNYINVLKSISQIMNKNIPLRQMMSEISEISKLYETSLAVMKGKYLELSLAEFVIATKLEEEKAPIPYILIKEGYIEREDYLNIDPKEFKKRKGVGVKLVEQLIEFQNKLKNPNEKNWDF